MRWFDWLVYGSAAVPLTAALRANRSTSLFHAVVWAYVGWGAWGMALGSGEAPWAYLALGLTGCAGVAVFGARRPGAGAWNFVVVGLLAVLALPLAESALLGTAVPLGTVRAVFLAVMLGTIIANYLPTRLGFGALALACGCAWVLFQLVDVHDRRVPITAVEVVLLAPWLAWMGVAIGRSPRPAAERLWLAFRDRFGLVWGQRLREQFNRAADNAGLPVVLGWRGLRATAGAGPDAEPGSPVYETLAALMKRFGLP